ncbi:transposase [Streptomyces sp. CA-210063]|uniref:transposase n=1 Tax=Streptomyces sp. CA-210063 TaxID=2801029 RepID=UPI00214C7041|nr:transposase [Streptomyces sp. CA-210063]UUU37419.1 transposase [Streptomyces sp. CA-210063]
MLQFLLGLSDRQAAESVRCRMDFKYAMAMELDDPGFHHSVLADFRDRLAEDDRADRLLDLALARLKEAGLVRERTTQRTDSTHVLASVRDLTRLEMVTEAVRAALEEVAGTSPHLLDELVDEDWGLRYGRPVRLGKNPTKPKTRILATGNDAVRLLEHLYRHGADRTSGPRIRPCARSWCRTTTATPQTPALAHRREGRRTRTAALVPGGRLALRHLGPLRTARTHHQLEGVHRPPDRDLRSRRPQRDHRRGHHRGHHPRQQGPARHPHPPLPPRTAARRAPGRRRLHLPAPPGTGHPRIPGHRLRAAEEQPHPPTPPK